MNFITLFIDDAPRETIAHMPWLSAQTDWLLLPNATIHTPICNSSRASLLTGRTIHHHGVTSNSTPNEFKGAWSQTLPFQLRAAGYQTGVVGKVLNDFPFPNSTYRGWHTSWTRWWCKIYGSTANYTNYELLEWPETDSNVRVTYGSTDAEYATDVLSAFAVDFASTINPPFYLHYAPNSPHLPAVVPTRHQSVTFGTISDPPNFNEADVSDKPSWLADNFPSLTSQQQTDLRTEMQDTWRMLRSVDESIESLVGALDAVGRLDETVIVFCTDNGNAFGEHRLDKKGFPYEEAVNAQMAVRWPGGITGTSDALVSTLDVLPTAMDVAGASPSIAPDGMSFRRVLTGDVAPLDYRRDLLISYVSGSVVNDAFIGPWDGVKHLDDDGVVWKYIAYQSGAVELYDLTNDPYELASLAGQGHPMQSDLASRLAVLLAE